jgi:peptide chain release factor 2
MYSRWIDTKKLKKSIIDINSGEEAGIKSITIKVEGENCYGLLKSESGVHRLVRISPFDSQKRRHTSFASVWVYPIVSNNINIEIENKDIRVDTYRASGAGGQHVNKTDSAIRITHIPTGIVVQCQNQRSQHQNKATALKMLESRLYELELRKIDEKKNQNSQIKKEIGWGSQIRSYVMQPYQMVKDLRTGEEMSDIEKVLDGKIDSFIFSYLSNKK